MNPWLERMTLILLVGLGLMAVVAIVRRIYFVRERRADPAFTPVKNVYIVGNPIKSPAMFFGRQGDIAAIRDWVTQDGSQVILLKGGRRSGKTSMLFQIVQGRLGWEAGVPVFVDFHSMVPHIRTDDELAIRILDTLRSSDSIRKLGIPSIADGHGGPEVLLLVVDEILTRIAPRPLLLLCDEFEAVESLLTDGTIGVKAFRWLRPLLDRAVFFIVTGSREFGAGLADVLDAVTQVKDISLFSQEDATALIKEPMAGQIAYTDAATRAIYRLSGGHPFFLQYICQALIQHTNRKLKRRVVFPDDLEAVLDFIVRNPHGHLHESWRALAPREQSVVAATANAITNPEQHIVEEEVVRMMTARRFPGDAAQVREVFASLLKVHVLERKNEGYRFQTDLLRLWIRHVYQTGEDLKTNSISPEAGNEVASHVSGQFMMKDSLVSNGSLLGGDGMNFSPRMRQLVAGIATLLAVVSVVLLSGRLFPESWGGLMGGHESSPEEEQAQAQQFTSPVLPDIVMLPVPEGSFDAGRHEKQSAKVGSFLVDKTEVTVSQYMKYVTTNPKAAVPTYWENLDYRASHRDHPITGIAWSDADDFCRWAEKRLPTGLEWEYAARGTDGREFPWGRDLDRTRAHIQVREKQSIKDDLYGILTLGVNESAYSQDVSPFGVLGMAGNVSEWTADRDGTGRYSVRGGNWDSASIEEATVHSQTWTAAEKKTARLGFRCAVGKTEAGRFVTPPTEVRKSSRLARIRVRDVLKVGSETDTPPMLIGTPEGPWSGFDYELAAAIAKHLGVTLRIVDTKYDDLPDKLAADNFDLIISGFAPHNKHSGVVWSSPYLEYGLSLIVRSDSKIKSVADLSNKRVGVFKDETAIEAAKTLMPAAKVTEHEDGYLELVGARQLDAFLYDFPYAQEEIKEHAQTLKIVQYNLTDQVYAVGVPLNEPELLKEVNDVILALRNSPRYSELLDKYLGSSANLPSIPAGVRVHIVKPGDTLTVLAQTYYQDMNAYLRIWDANKHRIPNKDMIKIGMKLIVP